MDILSKQHALEHYQWGDACDGWVLLEDVSLSVKLERMPTGTAEQLHYHERARQFFFILKGEAAFEVDSIPYHLVSGQGIHIRPGQKHLVRNAAPGDLEFILSSQPSTAGDRINCG
jgi:mannose-6-phosphate isomerase-like protein (cupin superfamily)